MKKIIILALIAVFCFFSACAKSSEENIPKDSVEKNGYIKITPEKAKKMMDGKDAYIILDVRTEEEYKEGHIEGAILIPHTEIIDRAAEELPVKNAVIMIYCQKGIRSMNVANKLVMMGYTNIYDFGGIENWTYGTVS